MTSLQPGAPDSMQGKTVLVTGGVGGLGMGCALRFARLGADLIVADIAEAAAPAALQQLQAAGARAEFLRLDLSDAADVQRVAAGLLARGRPLDVLVNNAGIYPPSQRTTNAEGHELTLSIAHFGHFRLSHALWPLLREAPAARVVTISSLTQRHATMDLADLALQQGYTPIRAYAQAKLANLLFALELQRRLEKAGSRVSSYAAHPGVTRTAIGQNRRKRDDDRWHQRMSTAIFAYWQARFGQSPEQGALPIVLAANSSEFAPGSFLGPVGMLEAFGRIERVEPGKLAGDPQLAQRLWEHTEAVTGLRWSFQ
ncbi:MAG TPA: SDR family NAD(P)-dependent oxidoreductase [Solimonas sp.]|nr:SDR family NAD(P)-dependent oxidoreductase [Solimonas sp.]